MWKGICVGRRTSASVRLWCKSLGKKLGLVCKQFFRMILLLFLEVLPA